MTTNMMLITIGACAVCMFALRYIPFVLFKGDSVPTIVKRLGVVLPPAIMATLVVYCVRSTQWLEMSSGIPVIAGVLSTALIHIWKKNTILSVFVGTAVYMILIYVM